MHLLAGKLFGSFLDSSNWAWPAFSGVTAGASGDGRDLGGDGRVAPSISVRKGLALVLSDHVSGWRQRCSPAPRKRCKPRRNPGGGPVTCGRVAEREAFDDSCESYLPSNSAHLHFGPGDDWSLESSAVGWPYRSIQTVRDAVGRQVTARRRDRPE